MKFYALILFIFLLASCNDQSKVEKEIEAIPIDVQIDRFDKVFAATTEQNLPEVKRKYPIFFPQQFNDSIWIEKINDTLQNQLEEEVVKKFPNDEYLEEVLEPLFQHIKYYFPKFKNPNVVTIISDVDYRNKIILAENMLVIGLDNYLGSDHFFYEGIEKYITKEMKPSQIGPDVAEVYARQFVAPPKTRSLLSIMIYFGKKLYLNDVFLPNIPDAEKIGYTEEEYLWSTENEQYMWRYFVEKELLYSTDQKLVARFISPAPFSKFYLEIDNESPGMLGRFLGWQIVKSYMENNDASVQQLMVMDAEEIFTNSKYKPKK
ncbi:gliding motility lipoprotein GldB [Aequorivita echinoideorum]|uniref:Gliding motility lipoprotein GldB n=1 Tax=Aequorivita echinoideorum TaxID=1549647 RepID=A0ABS5S088_9FLAO|nr:gliding motility lipoprotein GldB [Aequorivita echinoideorum]MBT0606634.1 gliding motility lipoprotein GldB [Aequorivita echinoideorum]